MKIIAAIMQHETNTFSSLATPYEAFAGATGFALPPAGEDAVSAFGAATVLSPPSSISRAPRAPRW